MQDMARELAATRPSPGEQLVLEFHDPLLPMVVTAGASVIAAATCVFAVVAAWRWLLCYEVWHETGEWPLPEAK